MNARIGIRALRVVGISLTLLLVLLALAYSEIFGAIKGEVSLWASYTLGVPAGMSDTLAWFLAVIATPAVVTLVGRATFGRLSLHHAVLLAGALVVATAAVGWLRADWMFGPDGRSLVYLCRPLLAGQVPRIQAPAVDPVTGEKCAPVTAETARTVYAMRRGVLPELVHVGTTSELDALALFDAGNGATLLYEGAPAPGSTEVNVYRGAGFDPNSPTLLRELTPAAKSRLRAALQAREARDNAAADAAALKLEKQRKRAEARIRASAIVAARRALSAVEADALVQAAASPSESPLTIPPQRRVEATSELATPTADWQTFFVRDPEVSPGRIATAYFIVRRMREDIPVSLVHDVTLDVASTPLVDIARPMLFLAIDFPALVLARNVDSLSAIAFPPGLSAVYFIDILDACLSCQPRWVDARWVHVELPARKVTISTERKYL